MAFSPSFSCSQSAASPENVTLTDTSSGSDGSISVRRIYITDSEGNYVVPSGTSTDYIVWPYADTSIELDLLSEDMAVNILVQWLDVSNAVLYSDDNDYCLAAFNQQNFYYLTQQLALNPATLQDTSYSNNLAAYWVAIIGAINAVELAGDLADSQNMLNIATNFLNNQSKYF